MFKQIHIKLLKISSFSETILITNITAEISYKVKQNNIALHVKVNS